MDDVIKGVLWISLLVVGAGVFLIGVNIADFVF